MGGRSSRSWCPGKDRYIKDLNGVINGLDREIKLIIQGIKVLDVNEKALIKEIIQYWIQIIWLVIQMYYKPLYAPDNTTVLNRPPKIDFRKEIVRKEGFTPLKNTIRTADESSSKLPVTDLNEEPLRGADSNLHLYQNELDILEDTNIHVLIDTHTNPSELLEDLTTKKKEFEQFLQSIEEKKKELFSKEESFQEGMCENQNREIDHKKRHIVNLRKLKTNKISESNWRTNYNAKLTTYKNYLKTIRDQLQTAFDSLDLKNYDNTKTVFKIDTSTPEKTNLFQYKIASKNVENFEDHIEYGSQSGITPARDAYKDLYNQYYTALGLAYNTIDVHLQPQVDYLKRTELTGVDYSFETVKNENKIIQDQINENRIKYSTDTKKFFYQTDNFIYLKTVNFYLFIVFYLFFILLIYMIYQNANLTFYYKLIFIFAVFLYPFLIRPLEKLIEWIMLFMYSLFFGKVFVESDL